MIFKGAKNTQWGKEKFLQKTVLGSVLFYTQKINLKGIEDLDVRSKTIKLLQENTEESLHDTGVGNDFLVLISKAQATKPKSTNRTYHTLTTSAHQKTPSKE